ncbi:MAG: hypothetical protein SH820_04270 [Xanthomonadales bacterium]|nr:hypothetical protein [Xanthomonadales bacterium]
MYTHLWFCASLGLSLLFKSVSDQWLSSKDPYGDARRSIEEGDSVVTKH